MVGWEHFAHGADVGVRGHGPTLTGAFEQAAMALTAVTVDPERVQPRLEVAIACEAPDRELLLGGLRIARSRRGGHVVIELSIVPVGTGPHMTEPVSVAIDLIAKSGLRYQVTAMGTLVEGDEASVWPLVRRCHEAVRQACGRVITELRIDDTGDAGNDISRSVGRVEQQLAHEVSKAP